MTDIYNCVHIKDIESKSFNIVDGKLNVKQLKNENYVTKNIYEIFYRLCYADELINLQDINFFDKLDTPTIRYLAQLIVNLEIIYRDNGINYEGYTEICDKISNKIFYKGNIKNNIPHGYGEVYCNNKKIISGVWLNGFCLYNCENDNDKDLQTMMQKYKEVEYSEYYDYVMNRYNCGKLYADIHFNHNLSKTRREAIFDPSGNLIRKIKIVDKGIRMTKEEKNGKKIYSYDDKWQYPVITEKQIYDNIKDIVTKYDNYIAFPWATLIDELYYGYGSKTYELFSVLNDFEKEQFSGFSVCQHIMFRGMLPYWKKIGIHTMFVSHCATSDFELEKEYGIKLLPLSLYPNVDAKEDKPNTNKYLFSFVGTYNQKAYISNLRDKIFELYTNKYEDVYIERRDNWHYQNLVYGVQILKNEEKTVNLIKEMDTNEKQYMDLLHNSAFSLCPSGSGPNSIRLWESLSYGSIPVILSNYMKMGKYINWENICIMYDETMLDLLYEKISSITKEEIKERQQLCKLLYKYVYSKERMHTQIIIELTKPKICLYDENIEVSENTEYIYVNKKDSDTLDCIKKIFSEYEIIDCHHS